MIGVAFEVVMATNDHTLAPPLHLASELYPPSVLHGVTPKTTSFNRCCPNAVFKTKILKLLCLLTILSTLCVKSVSAFWFSALCDGRCTCCYLKPKRVHICMTSRCVVITFFFRSHPDCRSVHACIPFQQTPLCT